jgi:hypothetical protein
MQNILDKAIERKAYELLSAQGLEQSLIEFKIKELLICAERGYNTRAELIGLIKKAGQ